MGVANQGVWILSPLSPLNNPGYRPGNSDINSPLTVHGDMSRLYENSNLCLMMIGSTKMTYLAYWDRSVNYVFLEIHYIQLRNNSGMLML